MADPQFEEFYGYDYEDLSEGMTAAYGRTVTESDIILFAGISGDTNPVHLNEALAADSMFKGRIAHGMLSSAFISTVFGTKLPGPGCIYLSQTLKFKAPVRAGDTVVARVTLTQLVPEKRKAIFKTECTVGETVVLTGEAEIMVPKR